MPGRAGRNRKKDPHHYWNNVASTKPEAQALATRLGLQFPTDSSDNIYTGLVYPIRRLITTGEDNPTNFNILLGPLWSTKLATVIKETRFQVLICPAPGAPNREGTDRYLDAGSPRWTPRDPNAEEQAVLERMSDLTDQVSRKLGGRKDVAPEEINEILLGIGSEWKEFGRFLETIVEKTILNIT